MKKNTFFFPAFLLLNAGIIFSTSAQPYIDLLNLKTQYAPAKVYSGETNSDLTVQQYEGTFLLPMEQKNKSVILFGGDATELSFTTTGNFSGHSKLYSTSLALGYEKHFKTDKWKLMGMVIPKINSDYSGNLKNDFQMGGIALATLKKSAKLKWHFGLYYNKEFFGDFVMPLVGIDWKINKNLNLWGDMPANLNLEYKLNKSFYAGAAYNSITASYRLGSSHQDMFVRDGDKSFGHNELKIFVNAYLTKHLVLFAEAGHSIMRMYQLYNNNNQLQTTDPVYKKNADGIFFNAGLAFRFRLDEE